MPKGTASGGRRFAVPLGSSEDEDEDESSEEEGGEEQESGSEESDPESEVAMEEVKETPDDQLTDAEKLVRAEARKEEGNGYFKNKNYPTATRLYSAAIALAPTNPAYLTNRAASLMASKSYSAALADCVAATALQIASPQSKTLLRLSRCQLALGLVLAAQQTLDQILKLDPSNPQLASERHRAARIKTHVDNVNRERTLKNWSMVLLAIDAASKEVEVTPREWLTWKVEALIGKKRFDEAAGQAACVSFVPRCLTRC